MKKCTACNGNGVQVANQLILVKGVEFYRLSFLQIQIQRLGPAIVQQFQSRCDVCGGAGETFRGTCTNLLLCGDRVVCCLIDKITHCTCRV